MGVGSGLYMYDVVIKRSRSLSHLLMSSCMDDVTFSHYGANGSESKTRHRFHPVCQVAVRYYPRESEGKCFHRRWFVCVSVCLSVTTITKQNKLWTDLHQILRKYSYGKGKIKFVFRYDW